MNKHEFYKELMKEYTFDSAKVRRSAKCSSLSFAKNKRWWHVPSTAAVAAIALTIGLYAVSYNANNGGSPVPGGQDNTVISSLSNKTLFLSFNNSITFYEMRDTLDSVSNTGNIVVEALYVLDENKQITLLPVEEWESFDGSVGQIVGAKVSAPAMLIGDLSQQQKVTLVKIDDAMDDNDFIPLITGDMETPSTTPPSTGVDTDPFNNEPVDVTSPDDVIVFDIPNALDVKFISDYRFVAITNDFVIIYEIRGTEAGYETVVASIADVPPSSLANVAILAVNGDVLHFATNTAIYRHDIATSVTVKLFPLANFGAVNFKLNSDLSGFVMNVNGESIVFTARNETFTKSVEAPDGLWFYKNNTDLLTDGTNYYSVCDQGLLEEFNGPLSNPERRPLSKFFKLLEVTEDSIRIMLK